MPWNDQKSLKDGSLQFKEDFWVKATLVRKAPMWLSAAVLISVWRDASAKVQRWTLADGNFDKFYFWDPEQKVSKSQAGV